MSRKQKSAAVMLLSLVLFVIIVPLFRDGSIEITRQLDAPSPSHPFGCDVLGRDLLGRVAEGGRSSLAIGLSVALLATALSLLLTAIAMTSRVADELILRFCDVVKAIPSTLLSILLMVLFGNGVGNLVLVLTLVNIPSSVRFFRSRALVILKSDFILAGVGLGLRWRTQIRNTILPHMLSQIEVHFAYLFSSAILSEAGLSFIGAGLGAGEASWGALIAEGRSAFLTSPHLLIFPSLLLFLTVFALGLLTDEEG